MRIERIVLAFMYIYLSGCIGGEKIKQVNDSDIEQHIERRYNLLYNDFLKNRQFPRSESGTSIDWVASSDWTSGFFSGCLYYLHQLTGNIEWKERYDYSLRYLVSEQYHNSSHDVGFIISSSFGRSVKYLDYSSYNDEEIIVNAAHSLASRYNSETGTFVAWDHTAFRNPLIVDNLMNLDIIYHGLDFQYDSVHHQMAMSHLEASIRILRRLDDTWYHIAEFDSSGAYFRYRAGQGAGINSVWTRGQSWAVYGLTIAYEHFRDVEYLEQAIRTAKILLNHLQGESKLNWDLKSDELRMDNSSVTILSSALIDIYHYTDDPYFLQQAVTMIRDLTETATFVNTSYFILGNSVGNLPNGKEISVPLIYADYYYLEALYKLKRLNIEII